MKTETIQRKYKTGKKTLKDNIKYVFKIGSILPPLD